MTIFDIIRTRGRLPDAFFRALPELPPPPPPLHPNPGKLNIFQIQDLKVSLGLEILHICTIYRVFFYSSALKNDYQIT